MFRSNLLFPSSCQSTWRYIYLWFYSPLLDLSRFSVSWSFTQSVWLTDGGSARFKAATCTYRTAQIQNKRTLISMRVWMKPNISAFEGAKFVHALDWAATVIGTCHCMLNINLRIGRAIAQAVSRRLPIAAARVQTRVCSCGILWWTKVALGQVFSESFGFPCQSPFHLLLHNHLHYHPRLAQ
jgi:hypothetical protein